LEVNEVSVQGRTQSYCQSVSVLSQLMNSIFKLHKVIMTGECGRQVTVLLAV